MLLKTDGPDTVINNVRLDRWEGVGAWLNGNNNRVSLSLFERIGFIGLHANGKEVGVHDTLFRFCAPYYHRDITTSPSNNNSTAVSLADRAKISGCDFFENANDILGKGCHDTIISNNTFTQVVHLAGQNLIISNNTFESDDQNPLTVENDASSYVASLVGNVLRGMGNGGDANGNNDIIDRPSYSQTPVLHAAGNDNLDIDRMYQQKAFAKVPLEGASRNAGESMPFSSVEHARLIIVNTANNTFSVPRGMFVNIDIPVVKLQGEHNEGVFTVEDATDGSTYAQVPFAGTRSADTTKYFAVVNTLQTYLKPGSEYAIYPYETLDNHVGVPVTYVAGSVLTITDVE